MKRIVGVAVWLVVLFGVMSWPVVAYNWSLAPTVYEETTITDYRADFTVDDDGDLHATETLTVNFPGFGKHGIFRFFDEADPSATHARRVPHDFSVTLDGSPEPYEVLDEKNGRITNLKIGSADVTIDQGEHTYVIGYTIDGVLEPGTTGQTTQFYWNLIPGGWQQSIDKAELTVHLPVAARVGAVRARRRPDGWLYGGGRGHRDPHGQRRVAVAQHAGHREDRARDAHPARGRQRAVVGAVRPGARAQRHQPRAGGADRPGGRRVRRVQAGRTREKTPPYPLMYGPPDGIGPAQGAYILTEKTDKEAFVASIMQAAEKGAIDLARPGDEWAITDKAGPGGWAGLDPVTQRVARLTGGPGLTFTASPHDVDAGQKLKSELSGFESATRSWAKEAGFMQSAGLGCLGGLFVIGGGILALAIAGFNLWNFSIIALIPGLLAAGAAPVLASGASTKRTATGRDLWSRVGGFRRVMSTPSSQNRFDFSGRQELYTQYIPWAVAFDCADEWAAKYRTETGAEPPIPVYFPGYGGAHTGNYTDQMVNSFSSTVDSAISSYQATQTSSSSGGGGGGFSGGGGGGGGGGGSW